MLFLMCLFYVHAKHFSELNMIWTSWYKYLKAHLFGWSTARLSWTIYNALYTNLLIIIIIIIIIIIMIWYDMTWYYVTRYAGKKGKEGHLYSAFYILRIVSKRSGMDHTVLPANTSCLPFFRKRSPDGATPSWGKRHPIAAYYSSIDPVGWKAELAWLVDI